MQNYIRLSYASTTNSQPSSIRQDLIDILNEAQLYNSSHDIYGVLFYGNDYFFQCIEGKQADIDQLYAKILKDKRHKNVVLLSYYEVTTPRFSNWSLKYVLQEAQVVEFFQQHQWEKFNPYALDDDLIEPFLNILDAHNESTPGEKEVVLGPETLKGSIINYKYAMFIVIAVLVLIVGLYFLTTFSTSNSIYGMPVQ